MSGFATNMRERTRGTTMQSRGCTPRSRVIEQIRRQRGGALDLALQRKSRPELAQSHRLLYALNAAAFACVNSPVLPCRASMDGVDPSWLHFVSRASGTSFYQAVEYARTLTDHSLRRRQLRKLRPKRNLWTMFRNRTDGVIARQKRKTADSVDAASQPGRKRRDGPGCTRFRRIHYPGTHRERRFRPSAERARFPAPPALQPPVRS